MYIFDDIKQHIENKHEQYIHYKDELRNYSKKQGDGIISSIEELLKQLNFLLGQFSAGDVMGFLNIYTRKTSQKLKKKIVTWLPFLGLFDLILSLFRYLYITLPLSLLLYIWSCAELVFLIASKRSSNIKHVVIHCSALSQTLSRLYDSIMNEKFSVLIQISCQTVLEIILSWASPAAYHREREASLTDLSELLNYEELEDVNPPEVSTQRRMRRVMHNYVPSNPFRATIRVRGTPTTAMMSPTSFLSDRSASGFDSVLTEYMEADSPASFPSTPFSRARVMNRCYERVDSLMFAARDKLRLEAQSASRDAYSRSAALKARTHGQYAVFDKTQASDGIALTCGNHCAMKVGKGLCCSCRAMTPIPMNTLVYLEFSITASVAQIPSIAVGFGSPDAPLNVMVGSWPCSVGLYSDGQLLIDSRWFQSVLNTDGSLIAGTTVGFLMYIPDYSIQKQALESDNKLEINDKDGNDTTTPGSISNAIVALLGTPTNRKPSATKISPNSGLKTSISKANSTSNLSIGSSNIVETPKSDASKSNFPRAVLNMLGYSDPANDNTSENIVKRRGLITSSSTNLLSLFQSNTKESPSDDSDLSNNKFEEKLLGVCDMNGLDEPVGTNNKLKDKKSSDKKLPFTMMIHVNGNRREYSQQAMEAAQDLVSLQAPLYPTVSLISENTRVWCRFCEADIVYRSREAIGAPANTRVYCLDGSLLLDENDD